MPRILTFAALAAMLSFGSASAQQPAEPAQPGKPATSPTYPTPAPAPNPPATSPAAPQRGVLGPAQGFTGDTTTLDTTGYTIGRRVFAAGSRNATWHMHTAGQLVFGEEGRGRLQIQGQPMRELKKGDTDFTPAGTIHWHGAAT